MTVPALVEDVQRKTAEAVTAIWAEARDQSAHARSDSARTIEQQRAAAAVDLDTASAAERRKSTADAETQSRRIVAAARVALASRLEAVAHAQLTHLRSAYPTCFESLAQELPARQWTRVIVNPADRDVAVRLFPTAEIVADPALVGGVIAEADGLRVTNTWTSRLAAAWPELLPGVMNDVLGRDSHSQPVA